MLRRSKHSRRGREPAEAERRSGPIQFANQLLTKMHGRLRVHGDGCGRELTNAQHTQTFSNLAGHNPDARLRVWVPVPSGVGIRVPSPAQKSLLSCRSPWSGNALLALRSERPHALDFAVRLSTSEPLRQHPIELTESRERQLGRFGGRGCHQHGRRHLTWGRTLKSGELCHRLLDEAQKLAHYASTLSVSSVSPLTLIDLEACWALRLTVRRGAGTPQISMASR